MSRTLLVIDIQNDYFTGGTLPLWQAEQTEARIVDAMTKAREAGDKIVLVQHISNAKAGLFAPNSKGSEIRPAILDAASGAPVVVKHFADAFQETELKDHLQDGDELLICGMMTQNCVAFTALSRDADPYRIRVIGDLCSAPLEVVHAIALNAIGSKTDVVTADEIGLN
ncbi:isochorismatase family protein [Paracoccus aurantiacus]|uniref:Isochorismatase family protein n=1 Tax=Paracoccus aurantiacus TaxID=2599412 RepID=A0A5C6S850_9RHOB|nr:isochorismatase family protein [Paracoccus aurantiacus]TXB70691.1 isochorismatase family protein [Paracoccus aurantiacus]